MLELDEFIYLGRFMPSFLITILAFNCQTTLEVASSMPVQHVLYKHSCSLVRSQCCCYEKNPFFIFLKFCEFSVFSTILTNI